MSDYQELRDAIAAATPGPWHTGGENSHWSRQICRPDHQSVAWCGHMAPQALRDAEYIAAANPQTIAALLADFDVARAQIARLTTLRPMSELTFADGNVLFHPAADAESASPTAEVRDVSFLTCRERSEWFNGWTPIPEARP